MFAWLLIGLLGVSGMAWLGRRGRWKSALLVSSPMLLWAWILAKSFYFAQEMPDHYSYERNLALAVFAFLFFGLWAGYGVGMYLKQLADRKTVDRKTEATKR